MKWSRLIGRLKKKAGNYLIDQYKKRLAIQRCNRFIKSSSVLNAQYNENLPDSENIWPTHWRSEKPNEVLVISAHDHVGAKTEKFYNGADDDGSGTVALLEIAQAFSK
jgi:Zn-dependent M28 family amino/carboxypeptidase